MLKKARSRPSSVGFYVGCSSVPHIAEAEQRWMDDAMSPPWWGRRSASGARPASSDLEMLLPCVKLMMTRRAKLDRKSAYGKRKEEAEKAKLRAARRAHMREKIGLIPNFEKSYSHV